MHHWLFGHSKLKLMMNLSYSGIGRTMHHLALILYQITLLKHWPNPPFYLLFSIAHILSLSCMMHNSRHNMSIFQSSDYWHMHNALSYSLEHKMKMHLDIRGLAHCSSQFTDLDWLQLSFKVSRGHLDRLCTWPLDLIREVLADTAGIHWLQMYILEKLMSDYDSN